jgi:5'-nucleotidase
MKKTILICNDDGFHAPGINALHAAVAGLGAVTVVAPATEQSAAGHAITVANPIKIKKQKFNGVREGYAVTGTPVDCIKIAASVLLDRPPQLLVSGINPGPNVGISVIYSGTVSAAVEGTILGIPSMAVSLDTFTRPRWETAIRVARALARKILKKGLPPNTLLNVNVPNLPFKKLKGLAVTSVGHSRFAEIFHRRTTPRGDVYYWLDGELEALDDTAGTDIQAVKNGYVSITPITFNLTNHAVMAELKKWDLRL